MLSSLAMRTWAWMARVFLNQTAVAPGGQVGMLVEDLIAALIAARGRGA
jgi:hypothetical protein